MMKDVFDPSRKWKKNPKKLTKQDEKRGISKYIHKNKEC